VTLHNLAEGSDNRSITSSSGTYAFSSIPPGTYQVVVDADGFAQSTTNVFVQTDEVRGVNVLLQVATANARVNVHAITSQLNPEETRVETTITTDELKSLPLPNRDTTLLLQLAPGTAGYVDESNSGGYGSNIFGAGVYLPGNINGSGLPGTSNLFLIDDLPVMSTTCKGNVTILPNPDMINQVSLQTQTFSVENGESSSIQTAFTTKSGSNVFHGAADFTYSGKFLTANQEFAPTTTGYHRHNLIGSLGGPIWKDHTFFFGSVVCSALRVLEEV
jgi:Carboxypeptidase regulatory-like domain/TonB-dependent Receptor Plug Domain